MIYTKPKKKKKNIGSYEGGLDGIVWWVLKLGLGMKDEYVVILVYFLKPFIFINKNFSIVLFLIFT